MADVWKFLVEERGLSDATLLSWGVERGAEDGSVAFPFPGGTKTRYHSDDGKRHFRTEKGIDLGLFGLPDQDRRVTFLVEGETDAMRLWQEFGENAPNVLAMPGIEVWKDKYLPYFEGAEEVYVILDNDADYKVSARVDKAWRVIRSHLGKRARRIYLPDDVNDICEFFDKYNLDHLRTLANRPNGTWHYTALDLTQKPQPPDWLVDSLICKGDLTMLIGEPGVGKSWISMSLAVALAEGQHTWLGRVLGSGTVSPSRVLYVDEENPVALVPHRLSKLGLTKAGAKNIRYLHRQGVRLDKYPDRILDEALDWEPTLIVLDSLTRLHTKDENNAGEVSALFNDGIVPLARETGATTLILHHVNKSDSGSSFTRSRGSGDISAAVDSGLDVRPSNDIGGISIVQYKSRWLPEGGSIRAQLADVSDDEVALVVSKSVF